MTTKHFGTMTSTLSRLSPVQESIDNPTQDLIQDAWVRGLTVIKERDTLLPEARTEQELLDQYGSNGGLFLRVLQGKEIDQFRGKKDTVHFSDFSSTEEEESLLDYLEDTQAILAYEGIEGRDELERALAGMDRKKRAAVTHFIAAWIMQERGYALPNKVVQKVRANRKKYNLPLELRMGVRSPRNDKGGQTHD